MYSLEVVDFHHLHFTRNRRRLMIADTKSASFRPCRSDGVIWADGHFEAASLVPPDVLQKNGKRPHSSHFLWYQFSFCIEISCYCSMPAKSLRVAVERLKGQQHIRVSLELLDLTRRTHKSSFPADLNAFALILPSPMPSDLRPAQFLVGAMKATRANRTSGSPSSFWV